MFNKYWREYPFGMQIAQLLIMLFIFAFSINAIAQLIVPSLMGVSLTAVQSINADSEPQVRIAFFIIQAISSAAIFIAVPLLFTYLTHPRVKQYLNLVKPKKQIQWFWVIVIAFSSIPVVSGIASLFDMIPLPETLEASKKAFMEQQKGYLNLQTSGEFVTAFLVMSIIPAIGEELMFRGLIMRFFAKKMKNIFWPILFSSTLFSLIHGNVIGFVSIIIAGMTLAYVYYLTGSLILSMFTHFIVNGTQIAVSYFGRNNEAITSFTSSNEMPWALFIGSCVVFLLSFFMLSKNKTPLPNNWTDDFNEQELAELNNNQFPNQNIS